MLRDRGVCGSGQASGSVVGVAPEVSGDVSTTIRTVSFAGSLRLVRLAAGLTQQELAERSGVSRPNITAYESGRREPLYGSAEALMRAAGATLGVDLPVVWSWTSGRRPYPVPSRLWRLEVEQAFRTFEAGSHLWWSGSARAFDLVDRSQRRRAYEIVLREGTPDDIMEVVDGALLCELWADLVLPVALRAGWEAVLPSTVRASVPRAS